MSDCFQNYVTDLERDLPELVPDKTLYDLGLFSTPAHLNRARSRGDAPPAIKLTPKKFATMRADLISWLRERSTIGETKNA